MYMISEEETRPLTIFYYVKENTNYFDMTDGDGTEEEKYTSPGVLEYVQNKLSKDRKYATIYFRDYKTHCEYLKEPFTISAYPYFQNMCRIDNAIELISNIKK